MNILNPEEENGTDLSSLVKSMVNQSKPFVLGALLSISTAVGIGSCHVYKMNKLRQKYKSLPTIKVYLQDGQGIESLTAKYVDTDIYSSKEVRNVVFQEDNKDYEKRGNGLFLVHFDRDYLNKQINK